MTMLTKEREAEIRSEVAALCGCGALERMGKDLLAEVDALRDERDELAVRRDAAEMDVARLQRLNVCEICEVCLEPPLPRCERHAHTEVGETGEYDG